VHQVCAHPCAQRVKLVQLINHLLVLLDVLVVPDCRLELAVDKGGDLICCQRCAAWHPPLARTSLPSGMLSRRATRAAIVSMLYDTAGQNIFIWDKSDMLGCRRQECALIMTDNI
jgi:uncharacterized protein YbaR (Trm112 family)